MVQQTFDDLGRPLWSTTFVVVDLETTGGSPATSAITEIGAVKVCGGEVLGEFQTLVNPGSPIPAFIQLLTGITTAMVADAPRISSALPAFLDFVGDRETVLVAHNARFDIGFLKAAAAAQDIPWPGYQVVDTVHLARQLVTREEVPNHKLGTLAQHFHSTVSPDHRALTDARATVDVLHALIGRVGSLGVTTLEELASYSSRVPEQRRRKRHLAEGLPSGPGVYLFENGRGQILYVGTARDVKRRVQTYFTASEHRRRVKEMIGLAEKVTAVECQTVLEAQVRELRLIAQHKPPYNSRSRRPERMPWVKLTAETFPRLSVVREVREDGATYLGPFSSTLAAQDAVAALHEALPLRQCTVRLTPRRPGTACVLAEMGRCGAPCDGRQSAASYGAVAERARAALEGDAREVVGLLEGRMAGLAQDARFEEAAQVRNRLLALVRGASRAQRLRPLAQIPELVAGRRMAAGGWEFVCVRHGRLAATTRSPRGADPRPYLDAMIATAEVVTPGPAPAPAASVEETELVLRWLEAEGTRLVDVEGEWASPLHGAGAARHRLEPLAQSWQEGAPFDE